MDSSVILIAAGGVVAAAAHAWAGTRYLLPRLFLLPAFEDMLTPTPRVRHAFLGAWLMGTLAILAFAALIPVVNVLQDRERIPLFVFTLMVLMSASPLIVGTYLGLRLRAKTRNLGMWFTVLLWAVLAIVLVTAWRAANTEASVRGARPNKALHLTLRQAKPGEGGRG